MSLAGEDFRMRIERRYQKLAASGLRAGKRLHVIGARLRGTELWFTSFDRNGAMRHFHGRLDGDRFGSSEGWPGDRAVALDCDQGSRLDPAYAAFAAAERAKARGASGSRWRASPQARGRHRAAWSPA